MKTIKLSQLLFSLAVIAALVMAAIPAAPAYAMAPDSTPTSLSAASTGQVAPAAIVGVVVCKNKTIWRDGHRITIRVCKVVHRHNPQ
ncbi:MAG: hypothetical protein U0X93_10520 [Anaerolineales bacterium]